MAYVIKITNKNNDPNNVSLSKLYLGSISSSLIINPDTPYIDYESDMSLSDGSVLVPLYQRQQFVKIPVNSVLVINTDNSDEAIYYAQCKVNNSVILVDPNPFGGSSGATLIEKTITENGTYNAVDDDADGYSSVDVNVPNSYFAEDEGKVVSNGTLVSQLTHKSITTNRTGIDTTKYSSVDVNVPNTYTYEDNGKVVNNETLVSQTAYPTIITQNDTYDTTNYNSVTVNVSGGGGGTSGPDVRFIDYNGAVVQTYSAADFANLSAMPANPSHTGLTAQGWNWSLEDAKTYVDSNRKLDIGQMYITSDGKTRLYFTVVKDDLSAELYLELASDTELDIDWGDGSDHTRWTSDDSSSSQSHEYNSAGRYVIAIEVIAGEFYLSQPLSNIYEIKIGNSVTSIGDNAFNCCYSLSSITISNSVTSIGDSAFYDCHALSSVIIPNSVTSIGEYAFYDCYSLSSTTIPNSVTSIGGSAFYNCHSLSSITIPNSVTSIGDSTFYDCHSLSSITIPNSVERIGYSAFYDCYVLASITIPESVTNIDYAFHYCHSLSSVTIPYGVTSISGAFCGCYCLSNITIPNSVTSIEGVTFEGCSALTSIIIPDSVASISDGAFSECYSLSSITFESTTPPDLGSDLGIETTCIIRVPQGSLDAYSNYLDPETYIYVEY